eukprot:14038280-Alexandrium_andersonii.AAC.1
MSASLVGSEMCIRDSRGQASIATLLPAPPRVRMAVKRELQRNDRVDPVSYTHLTLPTICSV